MKRATITETKNNLSRLLEEVKHGEVILIVDRDVPVARLQSAAAHEDPEGRLLRLERSGALQRKPTVRDLDALLSIALARPKRKMSIVAAVAQERGEGW